MPNIVDLVAGTMPWAGSLVPATITFQNLRNNMEMELVPALIISGVVEGMGFVTVATALDLYEQRQAELGEDGQARPGASMWVAVGGVVVYIVVVELVNAILSDGDLAHKATMGLLSTFGVLGGLMVALRNQLGKRRTALNEARVKREQAAQTKREQDQAEKDRLLALEETVKAEEREFERKMKEEKLRLAHELKIKKMESSTTKNVPERSEKVSKGAETYPETYGKWSDWRKVPQNVRELISKLKSAEEVSERFGVSLKVGGLWLKRSRRS